MGSLSVVTACSVFSPGFLPIYLLPAYEDAVNRPATPPPPYTPLQPAPPLSDPPDEACVSPLVVSVPIDADAADETPEATHIQSHSTNNHNKDLTPGRYRRFTGDSGIEVCDGQDLWDQQDFSEEMLEEEGARQPEEHSDPQTLEPNHVGAHVNTPPVADTQPKCLW